MCADGVVKEEEDVTGMQVVSAAVELHDATDECLGRNVSKHMSY